MGAGEGVDFDEDYGEGEEVAPLFVLSLLV